MEHRTRHSLLVPALLFGLSCLVLAPTVIYPFGRDQGIFGYAGHLARAGGVPFKDFWDPKPPALYYVYALAELLFGRSMASIRILDLLWQAATAVLIFWIRRRANPRRIDAAFAAGLVYILAYASMGWWNTAQPDYFLNLPLAGAVLLTLRACAGDRARGCSFSVGALAACAFYLKYPMGAMLLVCAGCLVWRRGARGAAVDIAAMAAGFAVVAGGYALYLACVGAWREFWYAEFVWVRQYARLGGMAGGAAGFLRLRDLLNSHVSVVALGVLALAGGIRATTGGRSGLPAALVSLWAVVAAINLYIQNKFYLYHFGPLLAPFAIGASTALAAPFDRRMRPAFRFAAAAFAAGVVGTSFAFANPRYNAYCVRVYVDTVRVLAGRESPAGYYRNVRFTSDDFSLPANLAVAEHFARCTAPGDTVFIWGYETVVYFLAGRDCPTRFIHNFPLRCPWGSARFGDELLASLDRARPNYIALLENDPVWWATGTREDSLEALRRYPSLEQFIASRYIPEGRIEDFLLFRRREGEDGDAR